MYGITSKQDHSPYCTQGPESRLRGARDRVSGPGGIRTRESLLRVQHEPFPDRVPIDPYFIVPVHDAIGVPKSFHERPQHNGKADFLESSPGIVGELLDFAPVAIAKQAKGSGEPRAKIQDVEERLI